MKWDLRQNREMGQVKGNESVDEGCSGKETQGNCNDD